MDVRHRRTDRCCAVEHDLNRNRRRNAIRKLWELGFDLIDRVDDIRPWLLKHCQDDAIFVVLIGRYGPIDWLVNRLSDVTLRRCDS